MAGLGLTQSAVLVRRPLTHLPHPLHDDQMRAGKANIVGVGTTQSCFSVRTPWQRRRFFRTDRLLYHKFGNMVMFRSGKLYSFCSPGNQDHPKITHFFFIKKGRNRQSKSCMFIEISCHY